MSLSILGDLCWDDDDYLVQTFNPNHFYENVRKYSKLINESNLINRLYGDRNSNLPSWISEGIAQHACEKFFGLKTYRYFKSSKACDIYMLDGNKKVYIQVKGSSSPDGDLSSFGKDKLDYLCFVSCNKDLSVANIYISEYNNLLKIKNKNGKSILTLPDRGQRRFSITKYLQICSFDHLGEIKLYE